MYSIAANGTGSLVFIVMWLLTKAAEWILKCLGLYYLLRFSQMLQNSLDGASQCRWTMTRSILQKQPKTLRQRSGMFCNDQVNHLIWIQLSMHFLCWRQNWRQNAPRTSRNWRQLEKRPGSASPGKKLSIWWCLWVPVFRQSLTAKDLQLSIKTI